MPKVRLNDTYFLEPTGEVKHSRENISKDAVSFTLLELIKGRVYKADNRRGFAVIQKEKSRSFQIRCIQKGEEKIRRCNYTPIGQEIRVEKHLFLA